MSNQRPTYINAPCSLFRGFADSTKRRVECINNALCYALAIKYRDCEDVAKSYLQLGLEVGDMKPINKGLDLLNYEHSNSFFSVNKSKLFEFRDNEKSTEECILFLAYHALKSIAGNRRYYFTTKTMMISRADGRDKSTVYNEIDIADIAKKDLKYRKEIFKNSREVLSKGVGCYSSRKGIDKIIRLLEQYYKVAFYTHVGFRGFYYSISLSKEELIEIVNEKRKGAIQ